MTEIDGNRQSVGVREKWEHEALDFTPWLAKNLNLLGQEIGLELKPIQTEKQVGPLSLDILAEEADTGVKVAIENQLEWTDTHHLGQLITYATGTDARIAVWVATEFRYEYAEALHRLNEWTREEFRFYGIKVEVLKGNCHSYLKPKFHKVVYPGCWDKDLTLPQVAPMEQHAKKYYDFFQPLINDLTESGFSNSARQLGESSSRIFPSRFANNIGYAVSFEGEKNAWVTFHIGIGNKIQPDLIFDALNADRWHIEQKFGPGSEWLWNRNSGHRFSSISIRRDGSIDDSQERLQELRTWMSNNLIEFKSVFDSRLEAILSGGELSEDE